MPQPTTSLATQRPDLAASFTEWDLEMSRAGFISNRVLPVAPVGEQAGTFGKIPIEQLLQKRTTSRAPGAGYSRGNWKFEKATYATEEHGAEEPVDDRESGMYANYFSSEQVAATRAYLAVLNNAEQRAADLIFNSTTWTGSDLTTAITNEWDDKTNAVPIDDVEGAVQKVWSNSGLWCNALIISRQVFRNLRRCAQIIDMMKAQNFVDVRPGKITEATLAAVFDLDYVIVAGTPTNSANEGQALSLSPIWSNEYAMVCRVAESEDFREPCIGRTFHWGEDGSEIGGHVESYRDEDVRSDIIRVRHDVDELVLYPEAGHLLSNVTT